MFKKQQYDKATLTYLGEYFCGATRDMKRLWEVIREYEIPSYKVAERIITQMLFSENIFDEEKIFEDYYLSDTAYFRLKQAYLAFVSREYILYGRDLKHVYLISLPENVTRKKNFRMSAKWHFYVIMRAVITRQT